MTLPVIGSAAAKLPVTPLATAAASLVSPSPLSGNAQGQKPVPLHFTTLLGALMSEAEDAAPVVNPKKQLPNPDPSAALPVPAQTVAAVIIPTAPRLQLSLSAPAPSKSLKPQPDTDTKDSGNVPAAADPLVQALAALPQIAPPPAAKPDAQGSGQIERAPVETLRLPPPEAAALQLSAPPDPAKPLLKPELAFSARITATSSSPATQPLPNTQAAAPPGPASSGGDQESDPGGDAPAQSFKQAVKSLSKPQPAAAPQSWEPAEPVTAQSTLPGPQPAPLPHSVSPVPDAGSAAIVRAEPAPVTHAADSRPTAAALPEASSAPKSEPLRDLSLRLGSSPASQVDVKIQERAGELHVSVLSSSPALTTDLRQQVGDLVGKLDRAGYHTETFRPSASTAAQQSSSQSEFGQPQDSSGREQPQNQQQNQGRQKRANQPQWMQEMNSSLSPSAVEGNKNL